MEGSASTLPALDTESLADAGMKISEATDTSPAALSCRRADILSMPDKKLIGSVVTSLSARQPNVSVGTGAATTEDTLTEFHNNASVNGLTLGSAVVRDIELPNIANFKVKDITPRLKDPEAQALLPKNLKKYFVEFEIHNVNVAIANGIRRTLISEMFAKCLTFDYNDFSTTDPFILNDYVLGRIKCIPVKNSIPTSAKFKLSVTNTSENPIHVKSSDIMDYNGKSSQYFNETFDLAVLAPGKHINITNIHITEDFGYNHSSHNFTYNVTCIPLDVVMYNPFNGKNQHEQVFSSMSNPKKHLITFKTNDTIEPKTILSECCLNIIARLSSVIGAPIESVVDLHNLIIYGESHTIGNILMKSICELYPEIPACTYHVDETSRILHLKVINDDNIDNILTDVVKHNVKVLTALEAIFKKL
jgi:DNA-directed RNA polymerase subunit L